MGRESPQARLLGKKKADRDSAAGRSPRSLLPWLPLRHPLLLPAPSPLPQLQFSVLLLCPTWPTDPFTAFYKGTASTILFSWVLEVQRRDDSTIKTGAICCMSSLLKYPPPCPGISHWVFFSLAPVCNLSPFFPPFLPPAPPPSFSLSLCPLPSTSSSLSSPGSHDLSQASMTTPKSFSPTVIQGDFHNQSDLQDISFNRGPVLSLLENQLQ